MEPLVSTGATIADPAKMFAYYEVTPEDTKKYLKWIKAGENEKAALEFQQKYVQKYVKKYTVAMQGYLREGQVGEMPAGELKKIERSVAVLSSGLSGVVTSNFDVFINGAVAPSVFEAQRIASLKVQKAILNDTLNQFKQLTEGAMAETQQNILTEVRTMQKQMIVRNQMIKNNSISDTVDKDNVLFKRNLKIQHERYYKAMEEGKILKSRRFGPNGERVINYSLEDYTDMATQTTIMNVDRTAVEVAQRIDGARVVEYYLRDDRQLKGEEREICQEILSNQVNGIPMLALDQESADALGIMTIDDARAAGAMGPHCRHSIQPVDKGIVKELFTEKEPVKEIEKPAKKKVKKTVKEKPETKKEERTVNGFGNPIYLRQRAEQLKNEIPKDKRNSVHEYTKQEHGKMYNSYLRGKAAGRTSQNIYDELNETLRLSLAGESGIKTAGQFEAYMDKNIKNISSTIKAQPKSDKSHILWRGIDISKQDAKAIYKPGKIYNNAHFFSCTATRDVADQFSGEPWVNMRVHAPKGTRFATVSEISRFKSEAEILMDRETKFVVERIREKKMKGTTGTMTEITVRVLE